MPSFTPKRLWQAIKTPFGKAAAAAATPDLPVRDVWLNDAMTKAEEEAALDDDKSFGPDLPENSEPPEHDDSWQPEHEEILGVDDEGRPHREDGPARIVHHAGNDDVTQERTEFYMRHGEVIARAEYSLVEDEEGYSYQESWFDAVGLAHRDGAPAVIVRSNHYIPEETYLDESRQEFWTHGVQTDEIDTTYEDIVSHKPLPVRQAFGWDIC